MANRTGVRRAGDGAGLFLQVSASGAKSWVFRVLGSIARSCRPLGGGDKYDLRRYRAKLSGGAARSFAGRFAGLIGAPSTGKTPALRPIVKASLTIERQAEPAWQAACTEHATLAEGARAIEEQWRVKVRAATKDGTPPPERPPAADAPPAPARPRVVAMDVTTEELQRLFAEQPRGLLYMRDELTGWLGNHDRYGGHGGDHAFYLDAWNGGAYVADRV